VHFLFYDVSLNNISTIKTGNMKRLDKTAVGNFVLSSLLHI